MKLPSENCASSLKNHYGVITTGKFTAKLKICTKNYCWNIISKNIEAHIIHTVLENCYKKSIIKNIVLTVGSISKDLNTCRYYSCICTIYVNSTWVTWGIQRAEKLFALIYVSIEGYCWRIMSKNYHLCTMK
jgi:hypothetical protein